ncbi:protein phosphatase 1G-like [Glandiceps talaboti]
MGAYLSSPVTDKLSDDKSTEKLSYGASAMQGWRLSMEDAHNCILNLDEDTAMFGVYDGHGGAEVAIYCAQHLPDFILNSKAYKEGSLGKALQDAFMEFDATLTQADVIRELKQLAGSMGEHDPEEDEEAALLAEEATLPLAELLVKYGQQLKDHSNTKSLRKKVKPEDILSPVIRKTQSRINPLGQVTHEKDSSNGDKLDSCQNKESNNKQTVSEESENKQTKSDSDQSGTNENEETQTCNGNNSHSGSGDSNKLENTKEKTVEKDTEGIAGQSGDVENGDVDVDEEDEDSEFKDEVDEDEEDEDEDEDEEDEDDDEDEEDEDDSDSDEEDDDEENDDDVDVGRVLGVTDKEEPGSDSGCTAVVALLRGNELVVANAGDSRCIVSRGGKAVDMSIDHKPEDLPERERIENAGGKVTMDGRVNGGLNLSRAIGDHCYKQNEALSAEEQMITAYPDIQTITLNPDDEFMVVACDGIWNVLSSQEVIDFVQTRLAHSESGKEVSLSSICEEMFDHCLAPDTKGDGTGCDNMTCMIVKFHPRVSSNSQSEKVLKRPVSPDSTSASPAKRSKN